MEQGLSTGRLYALAKLFIKGLVSAQEWPPVPGSGMRKRSPSAPALGRHVPWGSQEGKSVFMAQVKGRPKTLRSIGERKKKTSTSEECKKDRLAKRGTARTERKTVIGPRLCWGLATAAHRA